MTLPALFALMFADPRPSAPSVAAAWVFLFFLFVRPPSLPGSIALAGICGLPQRGTTMMAWRVAMLAFGILYSSGPARPHYRRTPSIRRPASYLIMGITVGLLIGWA